MIKSNSKNVVSSMRHSASGQIIDVANSPENTANASVAGIPELESRMLLAIEKVKELNLISAADLYKKR
jgi:hypothetical protein